MKLHLFIPILLVVVILILLVCSSNPATNFFSKNNTREDFFNQPSPSPTDRDETESIELTVETSEPGPSPTDRDETESIELTVETSEPGPSPTDRDEEEYIGKQKTENTKCRKDNFAYTLDKNGKIDYSDLGLFHCDLTEKITKIIQRHIGNVKLNFKYEEGKLIITTEDFDYQNIVPDNKIEIEEKIKIAVLKFMNKKYLKHKKPEFNINKNNIHITTAKKPTFIIIRVLPPNIQKTLSKNDREILEFYNFKNILDGKKPISSEQFLYNSYMSQPSGGALISNAVINNLHTKLNYLHLQFLAQARKNNKRNKETQLPSPLPNDSKLDNLGSVSKFPSPSPTDSKLDNLGSVSKFPSPSPAPI